MVRNIKERQNWGGCSLDDVGQRVTNQAGVTLKSNSITCSDNNNTEMNFV